jgi:hypothetical protein
LRSQLFEGATLAYCALCGARLPVELLVAAHIKPRSECTAKERRDAPKIVFALCLLGCDALYERGLASVDGKGMVVSANVPNFLDALSRRLKMIRRRRCEKWHEGSTRYFDWHFRRRFRGR